MFLLCMLCRLLLQLIQCMIPSLTISGYLYAGNSVSKVSFFNPGKLTASSLLLANSGFQCPFPSFCFFSWSCLCLSLLSARLSLSVPRNLNQHPRPTGIMITGNRTAIVLFQGPNTRVHERPRGHGWSGNNWSSGSSRIP